MVEVGTWSLHVKSAPRKKNPIKNSTVIDRESDSLSITVEFFFDCGFFSGCTFTGKLQVPTSTIQFLWWGSPIQAFLAPGWGEVLILYELICEYLHVQLQKKIILRNTPARSEIGFGIVSEFRSRTNL